MKKFGLWVTLGVLLWGFGCHSGKITSPTVTADQQVSTVSVEPIEPPKIERVESIKFLRQELDPLPFETLTLFEKRVVWFKKEDNEWWIDWDAERKSLKRLIIHHSASGPDITADDISEIQHQRIYQARYSLDENDPGGDDPYVKGLPIRSSHWVIRGVDGEGAEGYETFIAYHHLIFSDGQISTELQPIKKIDDTWYVDMVGWHVGKWEVNCESLGICLIGDFSHAPPAETQLKSAAGLIAYYRKLVPDFVVEAHKDYSATECPGETWDEWCSQLQ